MKADLLRIAMVGCGAAVEQIHLPSVQKSLGCFTTLLVDTNEKRTEELSRAWKIDAVSRDYRDVVGKADAAIVALPHFLHQPVVCELLESGIHVLVEKPMATSYLECRQMIEAAAKSRACLSVGLLRRFLHNVRFVAWILKAGNLGRILRFDLREGNPYSWPVQSDFFFHRETARGGVLMDTGAHTLDLLLWWLGDVAELEYSDDNYGGVEADCLLELKMKSGAEGVVELSRTRSLRNTAILEGENGKLEVHLHRNLLTLQLFEAQCGISGLALDSRNGRATEQSLLDLASLQLDNWIHAISGEEPLAVTPEEAMRSVALIENCYARRRLWQLPWVSA